MDKKEYQRQWYIKHKDRILEKNAKYIKENYSKIQDQRKRYRQKHRDTIIAKQRIYNAKHARRINLKHHYKMTLEDYHDLFEKQNGQCAICHLTTSYPLVVDHDHKTGKVRGLLCHSCNTFLGLYEKYNCDITNLNLYLRR